jgi:hypothetical protein
VEHIAVTYCDGDRNKARQTFLDSVTPRMRWAAKLVLPPPKGGRQKADGRRDEQLLSEYARQKSEDPLLKDREFVRRYHRIESKNQREMDRRIRAAVQFLRDARKRAASRHQMAEKPTA